MKADTPRSRLLRHALEEHRNLALRALVFVGDAVEESPDTLSDLAGQCGLPAARCSCSRRGGAGGENTFRRMAKLSGGAWACFDSSSSQRARGPAGGGRIRQGRRAALENSSGDGAETAARPTETLRQPNP